MRVPALSSWRFLVSVLLVVSGAVPAVLAAGPEKRPIAVRVDRRVELVSLVFRLAGNPEYGKGQVRSYVKDVEKHFTSVESHTLIEYASSLRAKYGVSFDACMSMAVHLKAEDEWAFRFPLEPRPDGLDGRWKGRSAEMFASRLNRFVKDGKFDEFFEAHGTVRDDPAANGDAPCGRSPRRVVR
jgi:hypothetical protein